MADRSTASPEARGFTLIEVILAIAVAGFVLSSATALVVSFSDIWMERDERRFFHEHAEGVTEFLRASFRRAGVAVASGDSGDGGRSGDATGGGSQNDGSDSGGAPRPGDGSPRDPESAPDDPDAEQNGADGEDGDANGSDGSDGRSGPALRSATNPIAFKSPPGFSSYRDPLLHFRLAEAPVLLATAERPAQFVDCYLHFDEEAGLSLLWSTNLQEETDDIDDLYRTRLSRWVTDIRYVYYDADLERWETEEEPRENDAGELETPEYLKLRFVHRGQSYETTVALPQVSQDALLF